ARGVVVGATLGATREQTRRALLDGVVLSGLDLVERIDRLAGPAQSWRASGGGARDPAWAQAMCDALGRPVDIVAHAGEALPAGLLALRALDHNVRPALDRHLT